MQLLRFANSPTLVNPLPQSCISKRFKPTKPGKPATLFERFTLTTRAPVQLVVQEFKGEGHAGLATTGGTPTFLEPVSNAIKEK